MMVYGGICTYMGVNGCTWRYMGYTWRYMGVYEGMWKYMVRTNGLTDGRINGRTH